MNPKKINDEFCCNLPCCGIFCGALIAGVEPQEVFDAYKLANNKDGRWRGSTVTRKLTRLLHSQFDVRLKEMELIGLGRLTVRKFWIKYADPGVTYLVALRTHMVVIDKGRLIDQWHCERVETAAKGRSLIEKIYLVTSSVHIPEGDVSGKEQHETISRDRRSANLDRQKRALPLGCEKHNLSSTVVQTFGNLKIRLFGYNARARLYPFIVEVFEEDGKPCSRIKKTNLQSARSWFGR